jgi:phospholipid-binding lipoprotein MlaA
MECFMVRRMSAFCLALAVLGLTGCSSQKAVVREPTPGDPFEAWNRRVYAFNSAFERRLTTPVTRTYRNVTPQFVKTGVANFVSNLSYPAVIMNDALQFKGMSTLRDTGRFVMNTTVGVVGFFDPATSIGLEKNHEDFGQTLGRWGLGNGAYLIVPFGGPTTLRDGLAKIADPFTNPLTQATDDSMVSYSIAGMRMMNSGSSPSSRVLDPDVAVANAFDPYVVHRSLYLQRRNYLIHDGNLPEEPEPFEDEIWAAGEDFGEGIKVSAAMPELMTSSE